MAGRQRKEKKEKSLRRHADSQVFLRRHDPDRLKGFKANFALSQPCGTPDMDIHLFAL